MEDYPKGGEPEKVDFEGFIQGRPQMTTKFTNH